MLPLLTFVLIVLSGNVLARSVIPAQNETSIDAAITNVLEYVFPNDTSLDRLETSVKDVNHKIGVLINDINLNGGAYLENLETSHIKWHNFSSSCLDTDLRKHYKASFTIELNLLEVQVWDALAELNDKLAEMKRSFEMEKSSLQLKLTTCFLTENPNGCVNRTTPVLPCFNESCSPALKIHSIQRKADITYPVNKRKLMSTECSDGKFRCLNQECKYLSWVCDGDRDCADGSDETPGCTRPCAGLRCRNLKCITEKQVCNGVDDCGDGTDEERCNIYTNHNCSLTNQMIPCSNMRHCIYLSQVCNGVEDCNDGSDEGQKCNDLSTCSRCSQAGGSCLRSAGGVLCLRKCPSNFVLDLKNGVCVLPAPGLETSVLYEDNSFLGTLDKLKLLFNRFSTGLNLLKKHMNYILEKAVSDANKCMNGKHSLNNPFLID